MLKKFFKTLPISFITLAAEADFSQLQQTLQELIDSFWVPAIAIVGSLTALWGIYVGIRFITAGDDEEKLRKAKKLLKFTLIGVIIAFILVVALPAIIKALGSWAGKRTV